MKKILLSTAALAFCFSATFAQKKDADRVPPPRQNQEQMHNMRMRREKLRKMNPEQVAKTKTDRLNKIVHLNKEQMTNIFKLYVEEAQMNRERMMREEALKSKVHALLDKEQNQKLANFKKEQAEKLKARRGYRAASDQSDQ